jgi:hypothetical protein
MVIASKKPCLKLLHFDLAAMRDGVHAGGMETFDEDAAKSIAHTRWLQLKTTCKLCDKGAAPKKGQEGCNPACKFDCIFRCILHNIIGCKLPNSATSAHCLEITLTAMLGLTLPRCHLPTLTGPS